MAGETDATHEHAPEGKGSPKPGSRRPKSSPEDPDTVPTAQGDEAETDSAATDKAEPSQTARERVTAPPRQDPAPAETKKPKPMAADKPKAVSLAERMRFSRKIKPRR